MGRAHSGRPNAQCWSCVTPRSFSPEGSTSVARGVSLWGEKTPRFCVFRPGGLRCKGFWNVNSQGILNLVVFRSIGRVRLLPNRLVYWVQKDLAVWQEPHPPRILQGVVRRGRRLLGGINSNCPPEVYTSSYRRRALRAVAQANRSRTASKRAFHRCLTVTAELALRFCSNRRIKTRLRRGGLRHESGKKLAAIGCGSSFNGVRNWE